MDKIFQMMRTIVLAQYEEKIPWISSYSSIHVVKKGVHLPNKGREPSSYLWYIIEHYDNLEGAYFFLQAKPHAHCSRMGAELAAFDKDFRWIETDRMFTCDMMGKPHDNVDIKDFLKQCNLEYEGDTIDFIGCCLFMVSAERIKQRPKSFYENMYKVLMENERYCYAFERCINIIFGDNSGL